MENIDFNCMRRAGHILAETLDYLFAGYIKPGISTWEVSNKAEEIIRSYEGSVPAFKGYHGFPECACVSVNDQVVHTIPSKDKIIQEGDLVSVDCGVYIDGHYSDACRTIGLEPIAPRYRKLIKTTKESLDLGIKSAVPGNKIGDISYAVQRHIERNRFKVSLEFVGHGIGKMLHGPPCVPNYGPPGVGEVLETGTCLAIEPVVFDGPADAVIDTDQWTVLSKHGNMSAHFEDTVLITDKGPEILTRVRRDE